ncbi:MAG: Co2+/Mg2+ efflux protein ApaG [Saprospiraceae bacterium]|nr:Co2+/Mg2+ efflux protein ApaG [Saprospiraceae bacterium]
METKTTNGIKISVETKFLIGESNPEKGRFCYAYRITIMNERNTEVQLLSRHWKIKDSDGTTREVKGEGVVGQKPVLSPGESHQYVSWCPLNTSLGTMSGTYKMHDRISDEFFDAEVPTFPLIYPPRLN